MGFSSQRRGASGDSAAGGKQGPARAWGPVPAPRRSSVSEPVRVPVFPGQRRRELGFLFPQISESRACPASRLEKDMELVPHTLKQGKSLVVRSRNKTCLATCHFNENTNLSQVSIPHTPPLPPATQESQATGGGRKKNRNKTCAFREHWDLVQTFKNPREQFRGKK